MHLSDSDVSNQFKRMSGQTIYAYLAGAMDSDGYFTIKRSTYHQRVRGDATQPVYSERIGLKQVTLHVVKLLQNTFGGCVGRQRGPSVNSKPLWSWQATDQAAAKACQLLLPYLRVKKRQCELLLELRESKQREYLRFAFWFEREHPEWASMPMLTASEAAHALGYRHPSMLSQALRNGSLLAIPWKRSGSREARFPEPMIRRYAAHARRARDGRGRVRPLGLMEWRERLYTEVKHLNKMGLHGTAVFHRTGPYEPADARVSRRVARTED